MVRPTRLRMTKPVYFNLRLPPALYKAVQRRAAREHRSINSLIVLTLMALTEKQS